MTWVYLSSSVKTSVRPLSPSPFDVWKVEGNQSRFLHSGRCGLWFPGAGGARLAVKYRWACRVWEVYGAPPFAKNNRGNCCSKATTTGRGKGRWSKHRIVISAPRSWILSFSVIREPEIPSFPPLLSNLFICLFNWVTHSLTFSHSSSRDEKSLFQTLLSCWTSFILLRVFLWSRYDAFLFSFKC